MPGKCRCNFEKSTKVDCLNIENTSQLGLARTRNDVSPLQVDDAPRSAADVIPHSRRWFLVDLEQKIRKFFGREIFLQKFCLIF